MSVFRSAVCVQAEERAERARMEAQAARRQVREARKQAKLERRRYTIAHPALHHHASHAHNDEEPGDADAAAVRSSSSSSSSDDDSSAQPSSFSFHSGGGSSSGCGVGGAGHSDLHHASYVRFNLNMPKDLPSRLPRRDILHFGEDAPLTECGHWQAGLVGEALLGANIQFVYASPALRCIQTAQAICLALGLVPSQAATAAAASSAAAAGSSTAAAASSSSSHARSHSLAVGGGVPSPFALTATPPSFAGIRVEYGLFEWMGWYRSYPHWLSLRELAHAGLHVDQAYTPVSLRPKQGETQREWYARSTHTMQRILARHFGTTTAPSSTKVRSNGSTASSAASAAAAPAAAATALHSRNGSMDVPALALSSATGCPSVASSAAQPLLYTHGNILFVAHAGSLDTLSYGLLHGADAEPSSLASSLRAAPGTEELAMGKRMRLFSNYCGTGRIQYVKHFGGSSNPATATATAASSSALPAATPGWNSRRNSLSLLGEADPHSSSSSSSSSNSGGGHWQIADDSHYDMTNTSNDPFSFQLSYASYQKTIAHLLNVAPATTATPAGNVMHSSQSVHALAQAQKQLLKDAQADGSGVDALVLRSPDDEDGSDAADMPPRTPNVARANSAPGPVASPGPLVAVGPSYVSAVLALPTDMLPLSFRKLFGALLDSANALANFLRALSQKQAEKLGQRALRDGEGLAVSPTAARQAHARATSWDRPSPSSPPSFNGVGSAVMLLQHGHSGAGMTNVGVRLPTNNNNNNNNGSPLASPSSSSLPSPTSGGGGLTVLDSWIMLEVQKTSPSVLEVLPREWSALLGYHGSAIPLHLFKTFISLRRFCVPLNKWQRMRKEDKNIVSWICMLHHIARSDCLEQQQPSSCGSPRGGRHGHGHGRSHSSPSSAPHVRCDFLCSLSSCIVAVDILARQGFAKTSGRLGCGGGASGPGWAGGSPRPALQVARSPSSGSGAAAPQPAHCSRELSDWIRRAENMRKSLKEARDGATGAAAASTTGAGGGGASRPSTPPPSSSLRGLSAPRSDGFPHSYDLLELVAGLEPVFGTDTVCADILKAVLLHSLLTNLVDCDQVETSSSIRAGNAAAPNPPTKEMDRFSAVLLANSSSSDATTSLTSSSTLPDALIHPNVEDKLKLKLKDLDDDAESIRSAAAAAAATPHGRRGGGRHVRHFSVPSSLLAILPSCVSPRLFECMYIFSMAHVSAERLTNPQAQSQALMELQEKVADVKEMWSMQAEQAKMAVAAAAAAAAAEPHNAAVDTGM